MDQNQTIQESIYLDGEAEDGEIIDSDQMPANLSNSQQMLQQFNNSMPSLNMSGIGFLGTESKKKQFDPNSFKQIQNFKLKENPQQQRVVYQGQKPDQEMFGGDADADQSVANNNDYHQPNVIGNEDSYIGVGNFDDKNDESVDYQDNQIAANTSHFNFSSIKKNQASDSKQNNAIANNSFAAGLAEFNKTRNNQLRQDLEEEKQMIQTQTNRGAAQGNSFTQPVQSTNNQNQDSGYEPQQLQIATQDFGQIMRSKQEIYSILLTQGQYYLPPYQECTVEFLRDVFAGRKKVLLNHEVRLISVPKLNELAVVQLINQVKGDVHVMKYLPDIKDKKSINRQFLYNVINTIKPQFFPENIRAGLERRKEIKSIEKNKYIEITSDMYNLVKGAINLNPSQRGRALHLLNVGAKKRKRPDQREKPMLQPKYGLSQYTPGDEFGGALIQKDLKRFRHNNPYNTLGSRGQGNNTADMSTMNQSFIQPQARNQNRN